MQITHCPTCGSKKIKRVIRNLHRNVHGQDYVVPRLTYHECGNCGEQVFDRFAMRKIQEYSPAYQHLRAYRKSA